MSQAAPLPPPGCGSASLRRTLLGDLKMVRRFPSLMVPPICPGLCSGMSITCGDTHTHTQSDLGHTPEVSAEVRSGATDHRVLGFRVKLGGVGVWAREDRNQ